MTTLTTGTQSGLPTITQARRQLAKIRGDIPKIAAFADFMKVQLDVAKKQGIQLASCNEHAAIMLEVQAEGGKAIKAAMDAGLLETKGGDRKSKSKSQVATLIDQGINKSDSSRWQKLAVVLDEDPEWFESEAADCTSKGKQLTQQAGIRRGQEIINEQLGEQPVVVPKGKYSTIVIDPPWPMEKIEREVTPNQAAAIDYPVMSETELAAMELPAANDCHLWLWTTHRFLPMAMRLAPVWGFKYVCTFVWHKPGGFQPFGLPQYNCEFALYCRKGSPKFATTKDFKVCFEAPRGGHSEKPMEFYDLVRRVTSGKRIDMFNRRKITGFKGWGNEAQ